MNIIDKWERIQAIIRLTDQNLFEEICDDLLDMKPYLLAMEIIKEKRVDVELLMKTESAKDYNKYSKNVNQSHNLGQRQYDFLKEVLL